MATLEELFRSYARSHPKKDGGTWNQWCGSLMFRLCDAYGTAPSGDVSSAWRVWKRTPTGGTNASQAPVGAFHFWDIGGEANGHVGIDLRGGGTSVGMATSRLRESLGDSIGINSVSGYTSASGARYVGWTHTYANGDVTQFSQGSSGSAGGVGSSYGYGLTVDAQKAAQQALTTLKLYTGKVDGAFGAMSVSAMQQYLKNVGLLPGDYTVDGEPGPRYGEAVQRLAAKHGYTGVIDGEPGTKTSEGIIKWAASIGSSSGSAGSGDPGSYGYGLTTAAQKALQVALGKLNLYTGLADGVFGPLSVSAMQQYLKNIGLLPGDYGVDGEPGPKYGVALQQLAARYGYTGAQDGIPGEKTSEALVKWAATITGGTTTPPVTPPSTGERWPLTGAFGIDVASPQRDIDFARAKADGVKFVIIKMGGLNVTPQYTAPHYVAQVGRARAAGLPIGHYYLPGLGQTPEQQAQYFVSNLVDFRKDVDVLALDNEKLDSNGVKWRDAEAARFITEVVRLTGIAPTRVWHYAGASDYRSMAPWPLVTLTGAKFWWAAYGANSGKRDHDPDLQGSIPDWTVHQFSSTVDIAGYKLDGNWSRSPVSTLFAKGIVLPPVDPNPDPDPEPEDRVKALLTAIDAATAPFRKG